MSPDNPSSRAGRRRSLAESPSGPAAADASNQALSDEAIDQSPLTAGGTSAGVDDIVETATSPDDAKRRLIAAAGPVFAEHGFDRATVRDICRTAGVNVAAVGYHFGDKFGLYREVIRDIRQRCRPPEFTGIEAILSPQDQLHLCIRLMLQRALSTDAVGWEAQLMTREMNHPTRVFPEMVEESFRPHFDRMKSIVAQLSPPDTEEHILEKLTLSIVGQCIYYLVGREVIRHLISEPRRGQWFDLDSLARHITGVILSATENSRAADLARSLAPLPSHMFSGEATT